MAKTDELYARLLANSVDRSKEGLRPLQEAAKEHGVVIVLGYQEVDGTGSRSTIFNSCAIIDADGRLANNHRKLMPTNAERMVWGFGDGSGLNVVDTAVGRIGTLICWENYMPLARYALYAQNIEIYVAPTWDSGVIWLATLQHIAREGGCWVIGCATSLEASDIPDDMPYRDELFPNKDEWVNPGDAVVYKPFGGVVAGPMHRKRGARRRFRRRHCSRVASEVRCERALRAPRCLQAAGQSDRDASSRFHGLGQSKQKGFPLHFVHARLGHRDSLEPTFT